MFMVIKSFTDMQDKNYLYLVGDAYPREGFEVSDERLAELSTTANRRGEPLIEKVEEPKEEKPKSKPRKRKPKED